MSPSYTPFDLDTLSYHIEYTLRTLAVKSLLYDKGVVVDADGIAFVAFVECVNRQASIQVRITPSLTSWIVESGGSFLGSHAFGLGECEVDYNSIEKDDTQIYSVAHSSAPRFQERLIQLTISKQWQRERLG